MDTKEFKSYIMDKVKCSFKVDELDTNFSNEFYYLKFIHLIKFNLEQYEVKDLGNMAVLEGRGFGIMKMITVVFTPNARKDIPLVIIDFIKMANKRTVLVEIYSNHVMQKSELKEFEEKLKKLNIKYSNIENYKENPNWYTPLRNKLSPLKKGTKEQESELCEMVLEYLQEYLDYASKAKSNMDIDNCQLKDFINNLIYKGNPSASILEKTLGKEETKRLFQDVVFYYDGR